MLLTASNNSKVIRLALAKQNVVANIYIQRQTSTHGKIWSHGKDKREKFLDDLNSFDNNIKFTHESSKEKVTFLDLIVKLSKGRLTTDLHIKDTDPHQ